LELAMVWFQRVVLGLLLCLALIDGNGQASLFVAAVLLLHSLVYWSTSVWIPNLQGRGLSEQGKSAVLSLIDVALGSVAFFGTGDVEGPAGVLGFCLAGIIATRFGLWLSLFVNVGVWLIFVLPFLYGPFQVLPVVGSLVIYLALTLILNYLVSLEARRSRSVRDVTERFQRLSTLYEVSQAITSALDMETVLSLSIGRAVETLQAGAGCLLLADPETGGLMIRAIEGPIRAALVGQRLSPGEGVAGAIVEAAQGVYVEDVQTDPRWTGAPDLNVGIPVRSFLGAPLVHRGRTIGAIEVMDKANARFGADDLEFLSNYADQAAVAIENARLYEATDETLNRRMREMAAIEEIDHELGTSLDPGHILNLVVQRAVELCRATRGMIGTLSPDGQWLTVEYRHDERPGILPGAGSATWPVQDGIVGRSLQSGEPLLVADVAAEPNYIAFAPTTRSEIVVPIKHESRVIGVLNLESDHLAAFTEHDLHFMEHLAEHAGIAIEKARLFETQQRQVHELSILFEASAAVSSSLALDEVLNTVARQLARALDVSMCSISGWDPVKETVTTLVHQDIFPGAEPGDVGVSYALSDYPATARVLEERSPLVVQVSSQDADAAEARLLEQMGQESLLMIPLVARDRVLGLLELYESRHSREFSADDIRLGQALANQAAVAIENARLYGQTDERLRARVDQLTALQRTTQELNATLALDRILQVVLEAAIQTCGATHGNVLLKDMDSGEYAVWATLGYSDEERARVERNLRRRGSDNMIWRVAESGQPLVVDDITREPFDICVRPDTRSAMAVPIYYQGAVVGIIDLRHTGVEAFEREDVAFVESLAEQSAIAIGNALRFEDQIRANTAMRVRTDQMARLLEVSQNLRADVPLEDTLEAIAYAIQETVGFSLVMISVCEGTPPTLRRVAAAGLPLAAFEQMKQVRQPLERYERILREEYRQGSCYFFPFQRRDDWQAELHTYTTMSEPVEWQEGQWHPQDMLLTPLLGAGDRLLGYISVDEPHNGRRPSRQTLEALAVFANQAAIAIENAGLYHDVQRRADNLSLINEVSQTLTQVLEPEQVMETVVEAVGLLLQCERAMLFQMDPIEGKFALAACLGMSRKDLGDLSFAPGEDLVGHVALTRSRRLIRDVKQSDFADNGLVSAGSILCVPMVAGDQVIGVLTASNGREQTLTEADEVLLTTLADQAAVTLENARLFASTEQAAVQLSLLNVIGRQAAAQLELGEVLDTTVNALHRNLGYYRVAVLLVDEDSEELFFAAANEDFWPLIPAHYRQPIEAGLLGAAVATGKSVLANDAQADTRFVPLGDMATPASLSVPILLADKVTGVLHAEADRRGAFAEEDVAALEIAADQLAVAIENARLFQETARRVAELATINEIGRAISGALDREQISDLIYAQVGKLLDTHNFQIALYDPGQDSIHIEYLVKEGARLPPVWLETGQGLTGHLVRTGQSILLSQGVAEVLEEHGLVPWQELPRSWLGVPMIAEDRVIGAITVQSFEKENAFDQGHLNLLATVASQAAIAFQNAALFQERELRINELSVLNEMAQAISSNLELDDLLETVYQQVCRLFDTTNFYIATYQEGSEQWTLALALEHGHRQPLASYDISAGLTGHIIRTRKPVLLKSLEENRAFHERNGIEFVGEQASAWMGVPLIASDKLVGVMAIQSYTQEHLYGAQDLALFTTIAAGTAAAVRNAQLYQQIVQFSEELEGRVESRTHDLEDALNNLTLERDRVETLYRITSELGTTLELERVLQRALDLFANSLKVTHGTITLLDPETHALHLRASLEPEGLEANTQPKDVFAGLEPMHRGQPVPIQPGLGLAGWVIEHREPVLVADVAEDPRWIEISGPSSKIRSVVAAPLSLGGGDILGVLTLGHPEIDYFSREHLKLVTAAAAQIAVAVNNSDLYAFITDQADQLGTMLQTQQAESAKNQAILESIADGVLVLDHNGRVLLINPAAEEMLGVSANALEGDHFRYILGMGETPVQRDLAQGLYSELRRRLESPRSLEDPVQASTIRLSAGKRALAVNLAPLITSIGGVPGLVAALRDISREVEVERLKNEFISTVSHELRTPMTSIKGYTDLLFLGMAGGLSDAQRNFLQIIKSNADRLTALVSDILDISRIETGRIRLTMEALDLADLVANVILAFREQYREKGITLVWEPPSQLLEVRGDRDRVTQVLNNLIANAWHYTLPGGCVTVSIEQEEGFLQVDVADTGIGISEENVGRVFDRFYRVDDPVVEEAGGTGLGLSIVKQFVEMLGGQIWVESQEGVGSTFSFTLPFVTSDVPDVVADLGTPEPAAVVSRRTKILVVEGDRDLALLLRRQLELEGYHVLLAGSGEDALWLAREEQPQLITLDIMLPDLDGFAVLEQLKSHPSTGPIPVVIASVLTDPDHGYALGAVDYVMKPFSEDELLESIQRALSVRDSDQPQRLLVVDDDADIRGFLEEALSYHGYHVWTAPGGREALEMLADTEIDLILLDLRMPGLDGYEVIRRLKANESTRSIPVIAITASPLDKDRDRVRVLGIGASQYLTKPVSINALVQEIKSAIVEGQAE
jgi:PAS domain S-box-containing protein